MLCFKKWAVEANEKPFLQFTVGKIRMQNFKNILQPCGDEFTTAPCV